MPPREIVLHAKAEVELDELYDFIAGQVGVAIAWSYISGVRDFVRNFALFPERGTIRESRIPGLRVIGYRRRLSIAFVVRDERVVILGFF